MAQFRARPSRQGIAVPDRARQRGCRCCSALPSVVMTSLRHCEDFRGNGARKAEGTVLFASAGRPFLKNPTSRKVCLVGEKPDGWRQSRVPRGLRWGEASPFRQHQFCSDRPHAQMTHSKPLFSAAKLQDPDLSRSADGTRQKSLIRLASRCVSRFRCNPLAARCSYMVRELRSR